MMRYLWHILTDARKWRVEFSDGTRSRRLPLSLASVLHDIFGGKVKYDG